MSDQGYWQPGQKAPSNAKGTNSDNNNNNNNSNATNTLSKSVMSMKFMKRKVDNNIDNNDDHTNKRRNTDSNSTNNDRTIKKVVYVNDNSIFATLPGRRSYGGFNKVAERHYEYIMNERRYERQVAKANKNHISDEEMAKRYTDLITSSKKSNQGSRYYTNK